jgi:chitinase
VTAGDTMIVPKPGNALPTAAIAAPVNCASYEPGTTIPIQASANDSDGSIASVEFFVNDASIGSVTASPYTKNWSTLVAGTYTMKARATDNTGATGPAAAPTTITVATPASDIVI